MNETQMILDRLEKIESNFNEKIACLEKKLLDPDKGLYTRVQANTNFRKAALKWLGIITLALIGLLSRLVYDFLAGRF